MVACAVWPGYAGAVENKRHAFFVQGDIHEYLIERTVHKCCVDGDYGVQTTECHSGCRRDSVLFSDSNVEDSVGKLLCELG